MPDTTIDNEVDELILEIGLHDQFDIDHKFPEYLKAKAIIGHKIAQEANKARLDEAKMAVGLYQNTGNDPSVATMVMNDRIAQLTADKERA